MRDRNQSRLASALTFLVGLFIAISTSWLNLSAGLRSTAIIAGVIIAIAGIVQYFWENTLPSWISALAAVWLFIAALAYNGGATGTGSQWTLAIAAIVTFVLAFWDGFEINHTLQHHHGL